MDTTDAYLMGHKIAEVLNDYELSDAFANGMRHQANGKLSPIEVALLSLIDE